MRYVARGDTTVLNAYLALPLRKYVSGLQRELRNVDAAARLELMQSNGGLAAADNFHAMSSILSGPRRRVDRHAVDREPTGDP